MVSFEMNKNTQIRGGKEQKLYLTKCNNKSRTKIVEGQKRTNQGTSISSSLPSSSSSLRPASSMNESATYNIKLEDVYIKALNRYPKFDIIR